MARANGYIIAKQFQKQTDNFQVSLDISPDRGMLVFGYGPMIKFVEIDTKESFWFKDKKTIGKMPIYCMDQKQKINIPNNQRIVRDIKWNTCDLGKNLIGVAMGQSVFIYDTEDNQTPVGFIKVFQTDDVMRQGDYPSKFVWYPNCKDIFLCTSNKSDQIIARDIRQQRKVIKFNNKIQVKSDQKTQDLKFNPMNPNIFATILKNSTIQIFDFRKPNDPIIKVESDIQNYKNNLLDWQWDGNRLVSAFGGLVKIWALNGQNLIQKSSFQHKNAISDFKWLRKHPQYLLVSQMQQNIVYGYKINKGKHDIEILVDPRHSGLKKFITDCNEQLLFGLTNFEDSKKHSHEMIAVFIDYKSSKSIWSKTKFSKPNNMGLDNQLLFSVSNYNEKMLVEKSYALVFEQFESSAKLIDQGTIRSKEISDKQQQSFRQKMRKKQEYRKIKQQRRALKKQIKQRKYIESSRISINDSQQLQSTQLKQKNSAQNKSSSNAKKSMSIISERNKKDSSKNARSLQKMNLQKKLNQSFSQSSEQDQQRILYKNEWILSYKQQVQYLDEHYLIQIDDQVPEKRGEVICQHNSRVASRIGKFRCSQFWKCVYSLAFPEDKQFYTLSQLYQDKLKLDVSFKDNRVFVSIENKSQLQKKTIKYSLQKLLQNLVDQNQLQTAVMACIMIRNKDQKLLQFSFIEPLFVCYKQLLKGMGLTFISTNLSFIAKLNQAVPSAVLSFDIPIGCGQCYHKFKGEKCKCLQVCIICGQPLISRLVIGCKICGHMAHAKEYQQIIKFGSNKCPYSQCQHQCFKKL